MPNRTEIIGVRVTPEDKQLIEQAARQAGVSVSVLVRDAVQRESVATLAAAGMVEDEPETGES